MIEVSDDGGLFEKTYAFDVFGQSLIRDRPVERDGIDLQSLVRRSDHLLVCEPLVLDFSGCQGTLRQQRHHKASLGEFLLYPHLIVLSAAVPFRAAFAVHRPVTKIERADAVDDLLDGIRIGAAKRHKHLIALKFQFARYAFYLLFVHFSSLAITECA